MLTEQDYINAAGIIGCDVAAVKAVKEVESLGSGFISPGVVKCLFEPHIFFRELKARGINPYPLMVGNEDILYVKWVRGKYGSQKQQPERLARAMAINEDAALCSASYGLFQLMGFQYKVCGYNTVKEFYLDMCKDEATQLNIFCNFIKASHLDDELRERKWKEFALLFNGSGYALNSYDKKLAAAYTKYST